MTSLTADGQDGDPVTGLVADHALETEVDRIAFAPGAMRAMTDEEPSRAADFPTLTGTASGRVPHHAFVVVGPQEIRSSTGLPTANDNNRAGTARKRSMWRDLFFLALLTMTIAGAFWSGQQNAAQRVIVVPGPSSDRHMVT